MDFTKLFIQLLSPYVLILCCTGLLSTQVHHLVRISEGELVSLDQLTELHDESTIIKVGSIVRNILQLHVVLHVQTRNNISPFHLHAHVHPAPHMYHTITLHAQQFFSFTCPHTQVYRVPPEESVHDQLLRELCHH